MPDPAKPDEKKKTWLEEISEALGGFFKNIGKKTSEGASWFEELFQMLIEKLKGVLESLGVLPKENTPDPNAKPAQLDAIKTVKTKDGTDISIAQLAVIDSTLSGLGNATDAAKYKDVKGVTLLTDAGDPHMRVSIDVPNADGTKTPRYFQRIDGVDDKDTPSGLKAGAWVETTKEGKLLEQNGKHDIHLTFGGYTGDVMDKSSAQTQSLLKVGAGELNPQAIDAAVFTDRVLKANGGKYKISGIIFGSHSFSASNAISAQIVTDLEGVQSKTTLDTEPVGASLALNKLKAGLTDSQSAYYQQIKNLTGASDQQINDEGKKNGTLDQEIADNTISIRALNNGKETRVGSVDLSQGLDEVKKQLIAGQRNTVSENEADLGNAMLGKKVYLEFGDDKPVFTTSGLMKDDYHLLANITNEAELHPEKLGFFKETMQNNNVNASNTTYQGQGANAVPATPIINTRTK